MGTASKILRRRQSLPFSRSERTLTIVRTLGVCALQTSCKIVMPRPKYSTGERRATSMRLSERSDMFVLLTVTREPREVSASDFDETEIC